MKRSLLLIAALVPALALAWKPVEDAHPVGPSKGIIEVQFPAGWAYDTSSSAVTGTRDGPLLDSIAISLLPHKSAFKGAKKPSSPSAAPEDLAESYVANLQAGTQAYEAVSVLATDPDQLLGRPAFRLHLRYRLPAQMGGALIEEITVGTALDSGLLLATYRAPALHYFAARLPDFEATLKTAAVPRPPKTR
jgi:hypothetical protein